MTINVDELLVNADWTKQTRDFPPGTLEEQAAEYGIEHPEELPASYLPEQALSAAYVEAEHPRDPSGTKTGGRWTKKGGGGGTSPAEQAQAGKVWPPVNFTTVQGAAQWFRDAGVLDVELGALEASPDQEQIVTNLKGLAQALVHETDLHPDLLGPNGLKGITTSHDPRIVVGSDVYDATTRPDVWAMTMPYEPFRTGDFSTDPYAGSFTLAPYDQPNASVIILNADGFPASAATLEEMGANGMAPNSPEQAFAHELGHVQSAAYGRTQTEDAYSEAIGRTEEDIWCEEFDDCGFRSTVMEDGGVTGTMAAWMDEAVSPYASANPGEALAETFVRATYQDSFNRTNIAGRKYLERLFQHYEELAPKGAAFR